MAPVTKEIIQYVIGNIYFWKTQYSMKGGASQDYVHKNDFLKKALSCLPNMQWLYQQALINGDTHDALSLLEHSGANQRHSYRSFPQAAGYEDAYAVENHSWLHSVRSIGVGCLCDSGAITQTRGSLNSPLSTMSCELVKEPQLSLEKWVFCVPKENTEGWCWGPTGWHFWGWWFLFSTYNIVELFSPLKF